MMDKVGSFHPSSGYMHSHKAEVLQSFLQHEDLLPLHTTPHVHSGSQDT